MDPPTEEAQNMKKILPWFDTIPYEIRREIIHQLDIGSWLSFAQCSFQALQESYQECARVLGKYGFSLKLNQRSTVCSMYIKCDTNSRFGKMDCYEGNFNFTKKSDYLTKIHVTRTRFPHSMSEKKKLVKYKHSELCWDEERSIEDLVSTYFGSYLNTFGKRLHTLEIYVDSAIGTEIGRKLAEFQQFDHLYANIKLNGANINFDQFATMKAKQVWCVTWNWSKDEVLKLLEFTRKRRLTPGMDYNDIRGTFDYDEEVKRYCEQYCRLPFYCRESTGVIYDFYHEQYETKVIMNRNKCTFSCSYLKKEDVL